MHQSYVSQVFPGASIAPTPHVPGLGYAPGGTTLNQNNPHQTQQDAAAVSGAQDRAHALAPRTSAIPWIIVGVLGTIGLNMVVRD